MEISDSDEIVDQLNYRGFSFSVYKSEADSCFYTILMGKPVRVCGSAFMGKRNLRKDRDQKSTSVS